ncbi:hypothetical protein B0H17DRAFT_1193055 [Mycena rosella]|uniref:Uncharacterized protein n=1 Tax=Mycena rosella TaxID=1033263 RepID=A0AAD7GUA6_MYCRO|nr:hypothetical protein B0H17DRAFT_1193055 [Mycena rosella]
MSPLRLGPALSPSEGPATPLASLTRLVPLRGHRITALHISSVFHLFFEPEQL